MKINFRILIVSVTLCGTALFVLGCGQSPTPSAEGSPVSLSNIDESTTYPASTTFKRSSVPAPPSLTFVVPEHVRSIFKRKCYICHGGAEIEGGFDLKQMTYQSKHKVDWQPMDLAGVTRIKLAILPLNGKPARMPIKAGSIWNPLTVEEANSVAKWTDYPYKP